MLPKEESLLAGKFKTQDELVKGYLELQKQFRAVRRMRSPL
jgi:hypothetical protein